LLSSLALHTSGDVATHSTMQSLTYPATHYPSPVHHTPPLENSPNVRLRIQPCVAKRRVFHFQPGFLSEKSLIFMPITVPIYLLPISVPGG